MRTNNGGWGTKRFKATPLCHPDRPNYAKGMCRECYRVSPHMRQKRREYYEANKKQWEKYARDQRVRGNKEKKLYGLPVAERDRMLAAQRGLCALCGDPPKRKALAVDHCHKTGKVRAFLCHPCNNALGLLKDDPGLCIRAAAYLRRHSV